MCFQVKTKQSLRANSHYTLLWDKKKPASLCCAFQSTDNWRREADERRSRSGED